MRSSVVLEVLILLLHTRFDIALGEFFDECEGIENETYIGSKTNCSAYIYCNGADSLLGYCDAGEYFVAAESACDYKENVFCPLDAPMVDEDDDGDEDGEGGDGDGDEPEDPDEAEEVTESSTESTPAAAATTTTTTTTTTSIDPLTIPPTIKDVCPKTDNPNQVVLIPNNQSCSDYYLCYHGHAIAMHCSNQLHFNTRTGRCDFPENAQCMSDRPSATKCLAHVTDFFPHPENCNYFYYCIKGFMTIQQCPFYYGWDIERRTCVNITTAKCYNSNGSSLIS